MILAQLQSRTDRRQAAADTCGICCCSNRNKAFLSPATLHLNTQPHLSRLQSATPPTAENSSRLEAFRGLTVRSPHFLHTPLFHAIEGSNFPLKFCLLKKPSLPLKVACSRLPSFHMPKSHCLISGGCLNVSIDLPPTCNVPDVCVWFVKLRQPSAIPAITVTAAQPQASAAEHRDASGALTCSGTPQHLNQKRPIACAMTFT